MLLCGKFIQDTIGQFFCQNCPSFVEDITKKYLAYFFLGHGVYVK